MIPRDATICEAVQGRHEPDEGSAGWLAALWHALAAAYHRDSGQAEDCNLAASKYRTQ